MALLIGSGSLATGATELAATVEQNSTTTEQLARSIGAVADHAKQLESSVVDSATTDYGAASTGSGTDSSASTDSSSSGGSSSSGSSADVSASADISADGSAGSTLGNVAGVVSSAGNSS
jgi:methyl-accepting chemotaxis protein